MQAPHGICNTFLAIRRPTLETEKWGQKIAKKWFLKNVGSPKDRNFQPKNACILKTIINCQKWNDAKMVRSKRGSRIVTPYEKLKAITGVSGLENYADERPADEGEELWHDDPDEFQWKFRLLSDLRNYARGFM